MSPRWMCQRSTTWAGVLPARPAIDWITRSLRTDPRPSGDHASTAICCSAQKARTSSWVRYGFTSIWLTAGMTSASPWSRRRRHAPTSQTDEKVPASESHQVTITGKTAADGHLRYAPDQANICTLFRTGRRHIATFHGTRLQSSLMPQGVASHPGLPHWRKAANLEFLLPAVLWDWRGFFYSPVVRTTVTERIAVFLDFQNVHLVGRSLFDNGLEPHRCVPDPARVADLIASRRRRPSAAAAIRVYRGRPDPTTSRWSPLPTTRKRRGG